MRNLVLLFILLLFKISFSQVPSEEASFLDKIDLIVVPEYQINVTNWEHKALDGKPYIQKPVSGHLNFGLGHILGIGIGLKGFGAEIFFSYKVNYLKNSPVSSLKLQDHQTIGKVVQSNFVNEDLYIQYFFNKNFGLGLNYKINAEGFNSSIDKNYPPLLNLDLNYKMLYLYLPFKFKRKKITFSGRMGYSLFTQKGTMKYFAAFLNYQDPASPDIPSTAGNATIKISNKPHSVFINFGVTLFSRIKFLYQFKYDWCKSFYEKYANGIIIQFAIPHFE